MSDSDDWENAADDILEDKPEESKKEEGKFADEDAVDSDEEREKAKEEAKKKQEAAAAESKKNKPKKVDYDQMFADRQQKGAAKAAALAQTGKTGELVSRAAEEDITDQLFSQELEMESSGLVSTQNYTKFATQVGDVLYEGKGPHNIPSFFQELAKGLYTVEGIKVDDVKKIKNQFEVVYNNLLQKQKEADKKPGKKGKEKPKLGRAIDNSRNNNPQMVADLMGDDDDYGDEYGDYGDESGAAGSQRVPENQLDDFM